MRFPLFCVFSCPPQTFSHLFLCIDCGSSAKFTDHPPISLSDAEKSPILPALFRHCIECLDGMRVFSFRCWFTKWLIFARSEQSTLLLSSIDEAFFVGRCFSALQLVPFFRFQTTSWKYKQHWAKIVTAIGDVFVETFSFVSIYNNLFQILSHIFHIVCLQF